VPVPLLSVQALLTVLYRPAAHAIGVPVLLASMVLYPVRELGKNL